MGKPEATNLMDMPLHVRFSILKFLWAGEYNAWEYNENDRVLIIDLHKLLAPVIDKDCDLDFFVLECFYNDFYERFLDYCSGPS
jgi:hypothetical protein